MGEKRHPAPTPSSGWRTQVLSRLPGGSSVARVLWALEAEFPSELASAHHGGPAPLSVSPRGGLLREQGDTQGSCSPQEASTLSPWDGNALDRLLWGKAGPPRTPHPTVGGETRVQGHSHSQPVAGGGGQGRESQTPTQGCQSPGLDRQTWRGAAAPSTPPGGLWREERWGGPGVCTAPACPPPLLPASWVGTTEPHSTARPPGLPALLESQVLTVPQ